MKFLKDGKVIGSIFCNCGWWWDGDVKSLYEKEKAWQTAVQRKDVSKDYLEEYDKTMELFDKEGEIWDAIEAYGTTKTYSEMYGD